MADKIKLTPRQAQNLLLLMQGRMSVPFGDDWFAFADIVQTLQSLVRQGQEEQNAAAEAMAVAKHEAAVTLGGGGDDPPTKPK